MGEAANRLRKTVVERVLQGPGQTGGDARRAAFDAKDTPEKARALLDKVTKNAWKVTDEDVAAVCQAGMTDDEVFELVVAAALGQATRQLDSALAALEAAGTPVKKDGAA